MASKKEPKEPKDFAICLKQRRGEPMREVFLRCPGDGRLLVTSRGELIIGKGDSYGGYHAYFTFAPGSWLFASEKQLVQGVLEGASDD